MLVACPECNTRYRVDASQIPAEGRALRCGKCAHVFRVRPPAPEPELEPELVPDLTLPGAAAAAATPSPAGMPVSRAAEAGATSGPGAIAPASPVAAIPLAATAGAGSLPLDPPATPAAPPIATGTPNLPAEDGLAVDEPRWLLAEGEEVVDRSTLRARIRAGEVDESTMLRPLDGGEPTPAGEVPELSRYFRLKRAAGGAAVPAGAPPGGFCGTHPAVPAEHACTSCQALYCAACVAEKEFGATRVKWCSRCDDRCVPYEGARNVVPFWREIPRLLVYPLEGWGPFMVLCCAVLSTLGAWLPGPGKVLYFFALVYQLHILSESARGQKKLPDWPDVTDLYEITERGMKALLVTLVAWAPVILFNVFLFTRVMNTVSDEMPMMVPPGAFEDGSGDVGMTFGGADDSGIDPQDYVDDAGEFDFERYHDDLEAAGGFDEEEAAAMEGGLKSLLAAGALFLVGNLILVPVVFLYYPMCLMIAAIWNTVFPALNPALILRCIGRIRRDYAIALVFCAGLAVTGFVFQVIFAIIPLLGAFLAAVIGSYLTFVQMHILGWTAWQGWDRLNWDIQV